MAEIPETIDVESIIGSFNKISIEGSPISYITRKINGEELKFVSVLMAETLLLGRYLRYFNPDIFCHCISVKGYYITDAEAKVLNYINVQCSSTMNGNHEFIAGKDCIVRLEDVQEFHTFLNVCYNKMESNINDQEIQFEKQFGYIRFESYVIPYFTKEGEKYLPLLFFEKTTDDLLLGAMELKNWDLAYLKFCCHIMGVYDDLYNFDFCTVVRFNNLKNYFPPDTIFEEFWPKNLFFDSSIINYSEHLHEPNFWITEYLGSSIMSQESLTANNANQVQINHSEPNSLIKHSHSKQ
ncbi:unnamed protein product [Aphis gossypii]|uniref:Uncharacterized protein n=1 Tax=Aphis gossypii TaxID=80765 RepID=A0A9P0JF22_APHGO|nr:unnamed protein product [Aphis gossypii]